MSAAETPPSVGRVELGRIVVVGIGGSFKYDGVWDGGNKSATAIMITLPLHPSYYY